MNKHFVGILPHWLPILSKLKMNLNHILVIERAMNGEPVAGIKEAKMLESLGWITADGKATQVAVNFLEGLEHTPAPEVKKTIQPDTELSDNGFEIWWKTYPASANFKYKGISYKSSRVLRSNKQVCEILYQKALAASGVSSAQMLQALKNQLKLAMDESHDKGQNRLEYWPGSEVYLRQGKYEAFLEMEEDEISIEEEEDTNWA